MLTNNNRLRMVKALPFIHQPDQKAPKVSNVTAADWWYQTHITRYSNLSRVLSRLFSGLEILVEHRSLYHKLDYYVNFTRYCMLTVCSPPIRVLRVILMYIMYIDWMLSTRVRVNLTYNNGRNWRILLSVDEQCSFKPKSTISVKCSCIRLICSKKH